jgi:hypothetical protein
VAMAHQPSATATGQHQRCQLPAPAPSSTASWSWSWSWVVWSDECGGGGGGGCWWWWWCGVVGVGRRGARQRQLRHHASCGMRHAASCGIMRHHAVGRPPGATATTATYCVAYCKLRAGAASCESCVLLR